MNVKLIALAGVLIIANIAVAQSSSGTGLAKDVQKKTATSTNYQPDASVTEFEAKAARMVHVMENFKKIDANHDGVVTRDELRAYKLSTRRYAPMT